MNNPLDRLNARERGLLMTAVAVIAAAAVVFGGISAMKGVRALDNQIAEREFEIESLTQQNVQADAVNAAYSRVVKQHSSSSTVAEIHDALRREIFRLKEVDLPPVADKPARKMNLVRIPVLQEGQLTQGKGHRDYQIRFQIPGAKLDYLLAFLERIEESEQLLRIDNLEIARAPEGTGVEASLEITRTVLDSPDASGNASGNTPQGDEP